MFVSATIERRSIEVNQRPGPYVSVLIHHFPIYRGVKDLFHTGIQLHQLTCSTWHTIDQSEHIVFVVSVCICLLFWNMTHCVGSTHSVVSVQSLCACRAGVSLQFHVMFCTRALSVDDDVGSPFLLTKHSVIHIHFISSTTLWIYIMQLYGIP